MKTFTGKDLSRQAARTGAFGFISRRATPHLGSTETSGSLKTWTGRAWPEPSLERSSSAIVRRQSHSADFSRREHLHLVLAETGRSSGRPSGIDLRRPRSVSGRAKSQSNAQRITGPELGWVKCGPGDLWAPQCDAPASRWTGSAGCNMIGGLTIIGRIPSEGPASSLGTRLLPLQRARGSDSPLPAPIDSSSGGRRRSSYPSVAPTRHGGAGLTSSGIPRTGSRRIKERGKFEETFLVVELLEGLLGG